MDEDGRRLLRLLSTPYDADQLAWLCGRSTSRAAVEARDWPKWLNSGWFMSTTDDGHAPLRAKPLQPASPPRGSIPALA